MVPLHQPATLHDPSKVSRTATKTIGRTSPSKPILTLNMQKCRSPTPDAVINEVINEICSLWDIQHVQQALPNGLSYRHTPDIERWGEEFLVLLLDLAKLTKGKLDEVKKMIQKRIDQGRCTKRSRDTCTTREDVLALIRYYAQKDSEEDADEDTDEDADEDPDEDYIPPVPKKERRYNP